MADDMTIRLSGHVISNESLLSLVNVPSRTLEVDRHLLRVGGSEVALRPGDTIDGARDRLLPGPWWWTLRFRLSDGAMKEVEFTAPGVGTFLGWLEQDQWSVRRSKRAFTATFPPAESRLAK